MHQYIHIFSLRIGAFPLFIGLGLLFIALLVFDTLRSCASPLSWTTFIQRLV